MIEPVSAYLIASSALIVGALLTAAGFSWHQWKLRMQVHVLEQRLTEAVAAQSAAAEILATVRAHIGQAVKPLRDEVDAAVRYVQSRPAAHTTATMTLADVHVGLKEPGRWWGTVDVPTAAYPLAVPQSRPRVPARSRFESLPVWDARISADPGAVPRVLRKRKPSQQSRRRVA